MLRAGDLDQRITLQRATTTTDDRGGEVQSWTDLGQRWCSVRYGTGEERRQAAQEQASVTATFRVRADSVTRSLTPKDRLRHLGADWDIVSAVPLERDAVDCTAVRRAE